jgi:hypothetical protein
MAQPGSLRASHADRERVIGMLEAAFAAGLLTRDEFDLGVDRTLASRTYADLTAAAAGLQPQPPGAGRAQPPSARRARALARSGTAAAWGGCGLVLTVFLTIVIIPSGTTIGVVAATGGVVYAAFWLLAGVIMLVSRRGWRPLPSRHGPDDQVRLGAAGHLVRQRRLRPFVG